MNYCFDEKADRNRDIYWLKEVFTPEAIREAGLLGYAGAEFEFPTCPALSRSLRELVAGGVFGYTLPKGTYLEHVIWWMQRVRNYKVQPEWIVSTHGTIFSLATTIRFSSNQGDNIIVPVPGYNRFEQAATRLGRGTVRVPLVVQNGAYAMNWMALEQAMAKPQNKILVLCNPNNPTGHIYSREELERIAALSRQYRVTVFSDEIFAEITFQGKQVVPYTSVAGCDALAITCTSLGKAFSLTGVNHANVIIENDRLRQQFSAQRDADHYGSVDPFLFAALTAAYTPEGWNWLQQLRNYLWENYLLFAAFMEKNLPAAMITKPEGTFVVWVDYKKTGLSRGELEQILVVDGLFAGDRGDMYFGEETCMRYSLAVPRKELRRSLKRLEAVLENRDRP